MNRPTLMIFVRYPQPGSVKTRLIPMLGMHGAAIAQHRMTLHTLAVARQVAASCNLSVELHVSGDSNAAALLYPGPWEILPERPGELGERLTAAMSVAMKGAASPLVVIIGDCPQLTVDHLHAAFDGLQAADMSLGPATDGGCYLIGTKRFPAGLFENVDWNADDIAAQIRLAAADHRLSVVDLPRLSPAEAPKDLAKMPPAYAPRRIAITGATGALGTYFLDRLLHEVPWLRVAALVRPARIDARPPAFRQFLQKFSDRITLVNGNLTDLDVSRTERKLLAESDGLWHFAASTNMHGRDSDGINWQTNDAGTQAVLDLLQSVDRPSPLFHISTAYVSGERTGLILEDDLLPTTFRNSYEASKFSAEQRVRRAFAAGLPGCTFRPSVVVEDMANDASLKMIDVIAAAVLAAARTHEPLVLRLPHHASLNCVHRDWLYASMTTLAAHSALDGKTYHLTARKPFRFADLAEYAAAEESTWGVLLDQTVKARELAPASRRLDRAMAAFAPYFSAAIHFDRRHFEADAPDLAALRELDARAVLSLRRKLDRTQSQPTSIIAAR